MRKTVVVLLAMMAGGCSGESPSSGPAMGSIQQAVINDQNHAGGASGFFFLDPIVEHPQKPVGQFVADLPVYVEIDSFQPALPQVLTPVTTLVNLDRGGDHYE